MVNYYRVYVVVTRQLKGSKKSFVNKMQYTNLRVAEEAAKREQEFLGEGFESFAAELEQ